MGLNLNDDSLNPCRLNKLPRTNKSYFGRLSDQGLNIVIFLHHIDFFGIIVLQYFRVAKLFSSLDVLYLGHLFDFLF